MYPAFSWGTRHIAFLLEGLIRPLSVAGLVELLRGLHRGRHRVFGDLALCRRDVLDVMSFLHGSDSDCEALRILHCRFASCRAPRGCSCKSFFFSIADGRAPRATRRAGSGASARDARAVRLASSGDEPVKRASGRPPLCPRLWTHATRKKKEERRKKKGEGRRKKKEERADRNRSPSTIARTGPSC